MVKKKSKKKKMDNEAKQLIWIFLIIGILFASFIIPYFFVQSTKTFELHGLDWYIEKPSGGIAIYQTVLPKFYKNEFYGNHYVYLRNDPRKNTIPTEANISIRPKVIITYDPEIYACHDQFLATAALVQITQVFPFVQEVEGGVSEKETANELNTLYANCKTHQNKATVFYMKSSNETSISQEGNCYILNLANCEDNIKLAERFALEIIDQLDYKKI